MISSKTIPFRFHSMASWYFRDANGLVLVYDITHIRSFERVSGWVDNVRKSAPADVEIFLVSFYHNNNLITNNFESFLSLSFAIRIYG